MSSTGYRQGQRRCPVCTVPLDEQLQAGVHVDVCPECSGVWLDWLDGDVQTVAAQLSIPAGKPRSEPGTLACPVCFTDLDRSTLDGICTLRCGTCAGAFLERDTLDELKRRLGDEHTPEVRDPFMTRILDAITRFVLPG